MSVRRVDNPPNPWLTRSVDWLGEPPALALEVYEEQVKTMLSANDSPDLPFRWSVNPYRGCMHACAYCYARPTHQWLGFGAGTDFDRRIVVKTNAAEVLQAELRAGKHGGEPLTFSSVTDCYQPLEASYGLTRRCLDVCLRYRVPVAVITKGSVVERDLDTLVALHRAVGANVFVSLAFADAEIARCIEPSAPSPARRLQTLAAVAKAGIPAGVALAPVIPGLNDDQIPAVLEAAAAAGATQTFLTCLRLPSEVREVFQARLEDQLPLRAAKVLHAIREVRGGALSDSRFGARMRGQGPRWQMIEQLFALHARRLGLSSAERRPQPESSRPQQGWLFGCGESVGNQRQEPKRLR